MSGSTSSRVGDLQQFRRILIVAVRGGRPPRPGSCRYLPECIVGEGDRLLGRIGLLGGKSGARIIRPMRRSCRRCHRRFVSEAGIIAITGRQRDIARNRRDMVERVVCRDRGKTIGILDCCHAARRVVRIRGDGLGWSCPLGDSGREGCSG